MSDRWTDAISARAIHANKKALFTPGPASLCAQNLELLGPAFGRGDQDYDALESRVLSLLKDISGHQNIARMQGSATLALEVVVNNFIFGKVLLISSGYYSSRLSEMLGSMKDITLVNVVDFDVADQHIGAYDWIVACYVETSVATKLSATRLKGIADKCGAKLFLDATASIGLEEHHHLADVIAYSSCKGLCGLTGASFVAFNDGPVIEPKSFYLSLNTHLEKRVTGPYHVIQSLALNLEKYDAIKFSVTENKQKFMRDFGVRSPYPPERQPLLCTYVPETLSATGDAVLYQPRLAISGSIICHLGEAHLGYDSRGDLVDKLECL